ncbi:Transcriptional regulator, MarR family [Pseudonocardia sp. Ae717_Ps2]|uniref:MarR family winged helix-turn-helix transcriptional regulator n=1 Tax=unclassified Pseudonocardia TaxID=2619320 RepID=UPI0002FB5AF8|nr:MULTISPECIES: MarR family winged helix-turn-helix transcriptional regulator [unclassified Pseudonocardia]OLM12513.1 Transcriptional regulator, MarR family [Pseudonocardia sp. Ae505_Ps2]OLM29835.1 Transcriptional regulator, MarR family [Pseudonocardia sp. Ae717_Ps2]
MTEVKERDDDWAAMVDAVHDLSRVLRAAGEHAVGLDAITGSEHEVLRWVAARPGHPVSTVARGLGLQASNVSTTVRSLVERDLVERRADPADGRRALLHPTARAARHRELLVAAWSRQIRVALDDLDDADAVTLRAAAPALDRLAGALDPSRAPVVAGPD